MKKVLPILVVLAMALPTLADVAMSTDVSTPGQLVITLTPSGGSEVRGVALALETMSGDAQILAATDVTVTGLNTNIDFFYTNGTGLVANPTPDGEGHAVAKADMAGAIDDAADYRLPTGNFVVSSGYLDASGTQAGQSGVITITVDYDLSADSEVKISADGTRGGIVGDDLGVLPTLPVTVTVVGAEPECMSPTHPDYARWVQFNKPEEWCYQYQCRGDANGKSQGGGFGQPFYPVGSDDVNVLIAAFEVSEANIGTIVVSGVKGIAADFNHASQGGGFGQPFYPVGSDDVNELLKYFEDAVDTVPVCDSTHINFWITP